MPETSIDLTSNKDIDSYTLIAETKTPVGVNLCSEGRRQNLCTTHPPLAVLENPRLQHPLRLHGFFGLENMVDYRVNAGFNPIRNLPFDADYHKFSLHREGGRWRDANGRSLGFDPSGLTGKDLGQELDFTLSFPYKERIKFLTEYSVFFSGRYAEFMRFRDLSHFSYIQMWMGF